MKTNRRGSEEAKEVERVCFGKEPDGLWLVRSGVQRKERLEESILERRKERSVWEG